MAKTISLFALVLAAAALVVSLQPAISPPADSRAPAPVNLPAAPPVVEISADAPEPSQESVHKVVWHADFANPRRFSSMLTSINNMVTTFQNDLAEYDVRIVVNAHSIRFLTEDKLEGTPFAEDEALAARRVNLKERLQTLQQVQGVRIELCEITREGIGLAADKLFPGVKSVPSGVVRVAELQDQGFAYLKVE